ncbi:LamG-like jellyroll fold domain-containing protein [Bacillus sp. SA1-12]|uniref:LamG-like jellyroll fold domain-containing protein n=1 Tax=Bacillus sp. SA1-12 TaxID=1455638 RepID=UPI0018CED0EF|nr:LamG-like jellyroll fold domain-containing protein [Bacillus sp. SA1-12]
MRFGKKFCLQNIFNCVFRVIVSFCLIATILPLSPKVSKAEETNQSLMTDYQPTINEVISSSGFKHPGVGLTKEHLENIREQVRAQKEPWITYFNEMLNSSAASKTVSSSNQSSVDPTKPGTVAFNSKGVQSQFIADALKAYTQAILYNITGDETYRTNAMHIIRIWSQMDPEKYAYYTDAHIHSGIPLFRMVSAAEILRYTSTQNPKLEWTDKDTEDFTNNLINPVINTLQYDNNYFMNQHLYPLIGAMSGYIFTDNSERYNEGVEWFTVNKTAVDQGQNGSIKQLFRLVDTNILTGEKLDTPRVQIAEMGRDQAHSTGDVINVDYLSRMLLAQGTKVDPVTGTVSTADNAVNTYDFLNKRILEGADYFARYMLGYDTPWTPLAAHTDADGSPTIIYKELSGAYRGRIGGNVYGLYYYYKYSEGLDMEKEAPYFTEMFKKRHPFWWDWVDGGADYWLYIPKEAEAEGEEYLPKVSANPDLIEIENRYTSLDDNSKTLQEGNTSFVRINATEQGSKIAIVGSGTDSKTIGLRIRTNGTAKMDSIGTLTLPDTDGQWKYVTYTMNNFQGFGDLVYLTIKGNAATSVDIDHVNIRAGNQLTPPKFNAGDNSINLFGYAGSEAAIQFDFSATDDDASEVVTYQMDHKPEGAVFDESTGAFSWKPTESGTYSIVVSASDGNTVTAREVQIVVTDDRHSAVSAVVASYDANTKYIEETLNQYKQVYEDVMNIISSVSDNVFYQKLEDLNKAVQNLKELTPLLEDGSMDYSHMFVSSTFGNQIVNLLDRDNYTFAGYYLAENLTYYMDLGPNYRVSADSFQMQVRASFPERIGGVAIFGSNDKENWTRLTPDTTTVTEDMQSLAVSDDLKNKQFRFLKVQMIEPPVGNPMFELSEFRIFGERHEVVNKLSSVTISSDQSKQNRISIGDTVKLSFTSTEIIKDVDAMIQGHPAKVKSDDGINWVAEAVMGPDTPEGTVKFSIHYKTKDGVEAAETLFTTDNSSLYLVDESDLIRYIIESTDITDSSGRSPEDAAKTASVLFDGNPGSITDYRVNGSGYGGWVSFDFKEGGYAQLKKVELLARQDGNFGRIGGAVIQGSKDGTTWSTISNAAIATKEWQTLTINSTEKFRYIRIYNSNNWYGNMSEVRFHGESFTKDFVPIENVSIRSDNSSDSSIALPGDTVTLTFTTEYELKNARVFFGDEELIVTSENNRTWSAEYTVDKEKYTVGELEFTIMADNGPTVKNTTDDSEVIVIDSLDVALEEAENLHKENYTRLSYYQFMNQVQLVKDKLDRPEYSKTELARILYDAKSLLVQNVWTIYPFEGNAESSNGLSNGTVSGTPVYKEGIIGQAIELNGHDRYITLPENHPLLDYDEITVATWVKWNGGSNWQRIFDFGNNTSEYLFLTPKSGSNTLRFAIKNDGGEQIVETSPLPVNEWVHVAVTLGNNTAKLYVNGKEVKSANGMTIKPSDIQPTINYIGKSMWPDPLFNGMLDEFSIFNYALSADQIKEVYHNNPIENVDTTLLDFLLKEANKALNQGDYPDERKEQLLQAIEQAESVYEGNLTQEAVDHASAALDEAIKNLKKPVDSTSPEGQFTINKGAEFTNMQNVTLSLEATDDMSEVILVRYSYNAKEWTDWEEFNTSKQLTLPHGNGEKTVFVEFKDQAGNISKSNQQTITLDTAAPVIEFIGHQETYSVDSIIKITCNITDELSGVASEECQKVEGPAYEFELGINKVTAAATDKAGNTTKKEIQFTVNVDFDSLSRLTESFVTKEEVAQSLIDKLQKAKVWGEKNNKEAMNGQINAFENQLKAQSGKSISEENIKILINLLKQLKG